MRKHGVASEGEACKISSLKDKSFKTDISITCSIWRQVKETDLTIKKPLQVLLDRFTEAIREVH